MIELRVNDIRKSFGGLHVLKGVSFQVQGAELIGLIGPNGAGKTTLTNVLDGAIKPSSGTVYLNEPLAKLLAFGPWDRTVAN